MKNETIRKLKDIVEGNGICKVYTDGCRGCYFENNKKNGCFKDNNISSKNRYNIAKDLLRLEKIKKVLS